MREMYYLLEVEKAAMAIVIFVFWVIGLIKNKYTNIKVIKLRIVLISIEASLSMVSMVLAIILSEPIACGILCTVVWSKCAIDGCRALKIAKKSK